MSVHNSRHSDLLDEIAKAEPTIPSSLRLPSSQGTFFLVDTLIDGTLLPLQWFCNSMVGPSTGLGQHAAYLHWGFANVWRLPFSTDSHTLIFGTQLYATKKGLEHLRMPESRYFAALVYI